MRVVTSYIEGERFVHIRMTVTEAKLFRLGNITLKGALDKRIDSILKGETLISG